MKRKLAKNKDGSKRIFPVYVETIGEKQSDGSYLCRALTFYPGQTDLYECEVQTYIMPDRLESISEEIAEKLHPIITRSGLPKTPSVVSAK